MKKVQILLVENCNNKIDFFANALEESGLSFLCNTARSLEEAFKILKNVLPDGIFVNVDMLKSDQSSLLKN